MKITVTIDDDLLQQLKEQAHDEGMSLAEIINRVLRREIRDENPAIKQRPPLCQKTYPMGEPRLDLDKALLLAASLEDEELAKKMAHRKWSSSN